MLDAGQLATRRDLDHRRREVRSENPRDAPCERGRHVSRAGGELQHLVVRLRVELLEQRGGDGCPESGDLLL
jgi:hypothetical protein